MIESSAHPDNVGDSCEGLGIALECMSEVGHCLISYDYQRFVEGQHGPRATIVTVFGSSARKVSKITS